MARGIRVRVNIDSARVAAEVGSIVQNSVQHAAREARERAKANLVAAGRMDTGKLHQSINFRKSRGNYPVTTYNVGTPLQYGLYQEVGTQGPITPKNSKFLRFKPKGSNTFVFARSVRGIDGAHYLRDAVQSMTVSDFEP